VNTTLNTTTNNDNHAIVVSVDAPASVGAVHIVVSRVAGDDYVLLASSGGAPNPDGLSYNLVCTQPVVTPTSGAYTYTMDCENPQQSSTLYVFIQNPNYASPEELSVAIYANACPDNMAGSLCQYPAVDLTDGDARSQKFAVGGSNAPAVIYFYVDAPEQQGRDGFNLTLNPTQTGQLEYVMSYLHNNYEDGGVTIEYPHYSVITHPEDFYAGGRYYIAVSGESAAFNFTLLSTGLPLPTPTNPTTPTNPSGTASNNTQPATHTTPATHANPTDGSSSLAVPASSIISTFVVVIAALFVAAL